MFMGDTGFDGETYLCKNCGTSEHTDDWKCPRCGENILITAIMYSKQLDKMNKITFIRKKVRDIEVGNYVIYGTGNYIFQVLAKNENWSQKNKGRKYMLALEKCGMVGVYDNHYYNCLP
ncbi:MAG: hypothetical protein J1F11_01350 [Oscillospiraceae bacterium]|nr:hypothetical protein [Oscillospiraceae bacterium]